jgi:hypothetical protein
MKFIYMLLFIPLLVFMFSALEYLDRGGAPGWFSWLVGATIFGSGCALMDYYEKWRKDRKDLMSRISGKAD